MLIDVQWADGSPDGSNFLVVRDLEGQNRLEYPISKVLYKTAGCRMSPSENLYSPGWFPTLSRLAEFLSNRRRLR